MAVLMIEDKLARYAELVPKYSNRGIDLDEDWGAYIDDAEDAIYNYRRRHGLVHTEWYASVCHGVSKLVIVDPSIKYCLKVPFNGAWYRSENYNEETEEWEYDDDYFEPYAYANDLEEDYADCADYCENELIKYDIAVAEGFGEFFPETKFYGVVDGVPLYIQERVVPFGYECKDYTEEEENSYNRCSTYTRTAKYIAKQWIIDAINYYGEIRTMDFLDFITRNCLHTDLHNGNIGYTLAGAPVLLDWAGFRD